MTRSDFHAHFHSTLEAAGIPLEEVRALWARWTEWAGESRLGYALRDPHETVPEVERHLEVLRRLAALEPWAHIAGVVDFAGLQLGIDRRALIPRPETEELLGFLLAKHPENAPLRALDWCTGSGCLALGMKHARPAWDVAGWDASADALALARSNGRRTGLDIAWSEMSLTDAPSGTSHSWDIMVSNPPYIHPDESEGLDASVRDYEPAMALFSPMEDVLFFYRRIAVWADYQLRSGGVLWLECHANHAAATSQLFADASRWSHVQIHRDFCAKERFVTAQKL
jgi:release factor glutamine methyltransferase